MKIVYLFKTKMLVCILCCLCVVTSFAQDKWNFDANETKAFADWFKQPSTVSGKCNAEVLGIDINREGFSWEDMNTWANSAGVVFLEAYNTSYVHTIWGGGFSGNTTYKGRLHYLFMSAHKGSNGSYDETGGMQTLPFAENLSKVAGKVDFGSLIAGVVNLSGTSVENVKIAMNSPVDCYCNIRRNPKLKQLDLSGSNGKVRQFEIYSNALEGKDGLIMNNIGNGTTQFGDWLTNIDNNMFSFSSMPDHPLTTLGLRTDYKWGSYKNQYQQTSGMPIGVSNGTGYEIAVDEDIDLSAEYDIHGKMTTFTWKNLDGETITPTSADLTGWFSFGNDFIGKEVRCELRSEAYPLLALNTVWVKVVANYSTGTKKINEDLIKIVSNPTENTLCVSAPDIQKVNIYSLAGICVKSINNPVNPINISDLNPGLYTVKVIAKAGQKTAKIIKK